jgi:hypothetical protein
LVVLGVTIEYGVSALFGVISFLGAFGQGLNSVRATLEGTLERGVWLAFLVLACVIAVRLQMRLYPPATPQRYVEPAYLPATYGQPYPGQPLYPQAYPSQRRNGVTLAIAEPTDPFESVVTSGSGWPAVPPPPMPSPLLIDPDPTTRIELPVPVTAQLSLEETQIVRAPDEHDGGPAD